MEEVAYMRDPCNVLPHLIIVPLGHIYQESIKVCEGGIEASALLL
jgi:hypothetical protein